MQFINVDHLIQQLKVKFLSFFRLENKESNFDILNIYGHLCYTYEQCQCNSYEYDLMLSKNGLSSIKIQFQ